MSRGSFDRRLFDAVLLVLAGSGCQPPTSAPREPTREPTRPVVAATTDAGVIDLPPAPPDAAFATAPPDAAPPDAARVAATPDPQALCSTYRSATRIDPKKAKGKPYPGGPVYESATWDPARSLAHCLVVRDRKEGAFEVMRTPTCCPTGRGDQPCPRSYKETTHGTLILVEQAQVRPDGTAAKSVLTWVGIETDPPLSRNCGRRPEHLRFLGVTSPATAAARHLVAMAELEAASVPAFERLARELAMHGAPADLVRRARLAIGDEIRHARVMEALAARFGGAPRTLDVPALPCRDLAAIALENAVEGCVHEAYGALTATYQAECAAPDLRAAFATIARDERAHALLAEDVHAWILARLDAPTREATLAARARAERELRAQLALARACPEIGIPGAVDAIALFDAYFGAVAAA
jgi:hypothetical protein